jgi:exodeoxyribonuclease VII large subunit
MPTAQLTETDRPPVSQSPGCIGVSQVIRQVQDAVRMAIPGPIWVKDEVSGYKLHLSSGHHYFDLVERTSAGQEVLPCAIWKSVWPKIKRRLAEVDIDLSSGMEMLFQGEVSVYAGSGKLSFKVSDVYPEFTLGQLEILRRAVLARLTKEDLLGSNKRLEMPPVPLRLAVVSSRTAAGLQDFMNALATCGYGFSAQLIPTTVQGAAAELSICKALEALAKGADELQLDAVCIVRGGGSATDLAWWNNYKICAAIARMPVPVITGIGHEKDRTVADEVAFHAASTPTAAAQYLIGLVRTADIELAAATKAILTDSARLMQKANHAVDLAQQGFARHTAARLSGEKLGLDSLRARLTADARRILASHREWLTTGRDAMKQDTERVLRSETLAIADIGSTLATIAGQYLKFAKTESTNLAAHVFEYATRTINEHLADHADTTAAVVSSVGKNIATTSADLDHATELVRAYDPVHVLQRGFSITMNADGKAVRIVQELTAGETIVTRLADGQITSTVDQTKTGAHSNAN